MVAKRILIFFLLNLAMLAANHGAFARHDPLKSLKVPGPAWEKKFKSGSEVEFFLKGNQDSVNITVRLFQDIPHSAETFLSEVRKDLRKNSQYREAEISALRSEASSGIKWDRFTVAANPDLRQEFWARKLDPGTVLVVFYTALKNYYDAERGAFQDVLRQVSR